MKRRLTAEEIECVRRIRLNPQFAPGATAWKAELVAGPFPTVAEIRSGAAQRRWEQERALHDTLPGLVELGLLEPVGRYVPGRIWNTYRMLPALWDVEIEDQKADA